MPGLRVIAGKMRGFRLRSVPGDTTRPITDRTKEALFNIIGADIEEANFLDLFAGTGSVGIEAISRGAARAVFVDINRLPVETVRANLKATGLDSQAQVLQMDAFAFLEKPVSEKFDYIYIAPPQYKGLWKQALKLLDNYSNWLVEDGWVIVQIHPVEEDALVGQDELHHLEEFDRRNYGSTLLLFYSRKDP
jgi:16S rRNA (guanine966-N2)-methyltransferase